MATLYGVSGEATALDELSDSELVRLARLPPDRLGCWLWLSPFAIGTLLAVTLDAGSAVLGFGAAFGSAWLASRIRARSPRRRLAKAAEMALEQRFCTGSIERYVPAAEAALSADPSLRVVLLFSGTGLPHGGKRFIRIELGEPSRIALRSMPFLHDLEDSPDPAARLFRADLPLSAASAERVQALLDALDPAHLDPPPHFVYDGFPCSLIVLRRDAESLRVDLNLHGLSAEQRQHPSTRLLCHMLDLEDELGAPHQLIGGTSPWGDVSLERR